MTRLTWLAPLAFIALMMGGVGIAQATGAWVTSGKQIVVAAGGLAVEDVKGSMSLQQAADGLAIPYADLVVLIAPPDPTALTPSTLFKDLEGLVPDFSLSAFRETLRSYLAARSAPASPKPSPSVAASPSGAPTSAPTPPPSHAPTSTTTPGAATSGTGEGEPSVKGSMTLRQVAEANRLALPALVAACGLPGDVNPDLTLRELSDTTPGFDVQVVRDAVARLA